MLHFFSVITQNEAGAGRNKMEGPRRLVSRTNDEAIPSLLALQKASLVARSKPYVYQVGEVQHSFSPLTVSEHSASEYNFGTKKESERRKLLGTLEGAERKMLLVK